MLNDGNKGNVKFIMIMDSIKKEEDYNQVFFPLPLSLNKISLPLHFQNIANGK